MKKRYTMHGFTILEGLFAISVITIGLMVGLTLAISNLLAAQDNERRVIAANLAREGIEVLRNQRDTNWLRIADNETQLTTPVTTYYQFDDFVDSSNNLVGPYILVEFDEDAGEYVLSEPPNDQTMDACITSGNDECRLNYNPTTGRYGISGTAEDSLYHRLITTQNICWKNTTTATANAREYIAAAGVDCTSGDTQIGVLVTSHVRYITNRPHDIIAKELLYDWR